ncbi:ATP-dependent DNA helicase PIF1-like [Oratosquilla oratoria]|uniref:ATP-dependent DNA helicase PIF1-like n=1 Tax=Oratosquilla oratoria TaxID=337810 RepID=UPI003F75937C
MGNGSIQSSLDGVAPDVINIPDTCICNGSLIAEVFDNCTSKEMKERLILCPKNSECLAVNEEVLRILPSENKTYLTTDSVSCDNDEEAQNHPMEFVHSLTPSGMPPHRLNLKVGAIIMLRNLSITQGLCNGTRLEVIQLHEHSIEASIISGSHAPNRVLIPSIKLIPSDANIPFVLHRTQFPVRLSYSMTINKAQSQTFDIVGIYLPKPCFTHGQLYVAFSRARSMNNMRVKVQHLNDSTHGHTKVITFTRNIVY